jgi:hypothetical protein
LDDRSTGQKQIVQTSGRKDVPGELEPVYQTMLGRMLHGTAEEVLSGSLATEIRGHVQLIFTSPPFPLNRKKKYGNLQGQDYRQWVASFAKVFLDLLTPNGSIVLELGNAWEPGRPVMSTLALETLLDFLHAGNLSLCQQFVCYNPARLPTPAQWVNIERIRLKDAYTHVWWMAQSDRPKANNRRVLTPYKRDMQRLITDGNYIAGRRPSGHDIGKTSFLRDNGGAIPSNALMFPNTTSVESYQDYCRSRGLQFHPARMPPGLAEFFVRFLTEPDDLVLDPFAGSNTTGAAAEQLGRRWLSVEPDASYIEGSKGRFSDMFGAAETKAR